MESAPASITTPDRPCRCGHDTFNITPTGPSLVARCERCSTFQRNVPRAEVGLAPKTVRSSGIKPKVRARVLDRFGHACMSCGRMPPEVALHVDHIIPRELAKRYGLYDELIEDELNLAPQCVECNLGKSDAIFSARSIRLMLRCLRVAKAAQE